MEPKDSRYIIYNVSRRNPFEKIFLKAIENITLIDKSTERAVKKFIEKPHFDYFVNYLHKEEEGLNANTIIVELNYTSLTYLDDYLNYYALCYKVYSKECIRIHFFKEIITDSSFKKLILQDDKILNDQYLGYITIKPLPKGIIGATLLAHYTGGGKSRFYTSVREYPVNLFGTKLSVRTMPYQEQDGIVGSCASSALWFCFQMTNKIFGSKKPSPSDITI